MKPLHIFYAIFVSAIWGTNFAISKLGLNEIPPILFTCLRYSAVVVPLIFFVKRDNIPWAFLLRVGTVLGIGAFTFVFIGMKLGVSVGITSLIMQGQVIFTLILSSILLKDRPSVPLIIGVMISAVGVTVLIFNIGEKSTLIGLLFVLGGSFCAGAGKIILKQGGQYDSFRMMVWMSVVPPIPLLILSLVFETGQWEALQNISLIGVGAVFYNAFIATLFAIGMTSFLIKTYSPNAIAPYLFLVPVFGFLTGYLFLGEKIDSEAIFGCIVIFIGIIFPQIFQKIKHQLMKPKNSI